MKLAVPKESSPGETRVAATPESVKKLKGLRLDVVVQAGAGERARIFCSRLEAELVAVDGIYRTADDWGAALRGRAVQIQSDRGALRLLALD